MTPRLPKIAVVMPALNEEAVIARVIAGVRAQGIHDIVVVDDASSDNTAEVARAAGATVVPLIVQLGAWGATQAGIRFAVRKGFNTIITMDADGQHNPADISKLLTPLSTGRANVAIGACTQRGSLLRKIAWRWIKRVSGITLEDVTSGFRAYDRLALRRLASWQATLMEYQDIGVLLLLQRTNMIIEDIPVSMESRSNGKSRIFHNWGVVAYYMAHTLLLGFCKRARARRPSMDPAVVYKVSR